MTSSSPTWMELANYAERQLIELAKAAKRLLDLEAIAKINPEHVNAEDLRKARYNLDVMATQSLLPEIPQQ